MSTEKESIVFTNGCFDLIHPGHIALLEKAASLGDRLIVGLNSDASVKAIKGPSRPVQDQDSRRAVLMGLRSVDEVRIFDEPTPERIIKEIKPDVLVKGGDWKTNEIIGADFVEANGGSVVSIPLVDGHSSSRLVERIGPRRNEDVVSDDIVSRSIEEHRATFQSVVQDIPDAIRQSAALIIDTFKKGKKVLICGNGGSAADAQHLAAEFVGRYETERRSLPAIALTTDTSALTAISNDYSFERVFSRQVESLAVEGDCLIAISTSGNSPNIIEAVMTARRNGCRIIGLTGASGKKLASLCDACVMAPSQRTARIQEVHITVAHIWCEIVDAAFPSD